jgi:putative nucleotidyltransferase with HDIG domain
VKRILFVDDEPNLLDALKRMLSPMRKQWEMEFVASGREALRHLSEAEYDVLVTDVRMPEVSGIELLMEALRFHPQVVRIVLSGTVDHDLTLRSIPLAHQYLMKPCGTAVLRATIENALTLGNILGDLSLKRLIGNITSLPSVPAIYKKLMKALESEEVSTAAIGGIIAQDLGMTVRVLQLARLPGDGRTILSPEEAVGHLGVDAVRDLAFRGSVFCPVGPGNHPGFSLGELHYHSFRVAEVAREIAKAWGLSEQAAAEAFLGGLLHDIGKLLLGSNFHRQYRAVVQSFQEPYGVRETERQLFGATHAEAGAYLLGLWGLPARVAEIVARHHTANHGLGGVLDPILAVQLADGMIRSGGPTADSGCLLPSGYRPAYSHSTRNTGNDRARERDYWPQP